MNTPSTLGGNWAWRLDDMSMLDDELIERLYNLGRTYGRINKK
jgi:4-alpha-glucanotransferase